VLCTQNCRPEVQGEDASRIDYYGARGWVTVLWWFELISGGWVDGAGFVWVVLVVVRSTMFVSSVVQLVC